MRKIIQAMAIAILFSFYAISSFAQSNLYGDTINPYENYQINFRTRDSVRMTITDSGDIVVYKSLLFTDTASSLHVDSIRCRVIHVGDSSITIGGAGTGSIGSTSSTNTIKSTGSQALTFISGSIPNPMSLQSANGKIVLGNSNAFPIDIFANINVGVGTVTPQTKLHLHGANKGSLGGLVPIDVFQLFTNGSNSNNTNGFETGILANGTAQLNQIQDLSMNFLTDSLPRMTILANGYVGIGDYTDFTPRNMLHLHRDTINSNVFEQFSTASTGSTNSSGFRIGLFYNTDTVTTPNNNNRNFLDAEFRSFDNGDINFYTRDTQRMTIIGANTLNVDSNWNNGFVGIGTVKSPACFLHIGDDLPTSAGGLRKWMRVGTYNAWTTDNAYFGLMADEDAVTPFDHQDGVIAWGDNKDPGYGPDHFRIIFGGKPASGGTQGLMHGLEVSRYTSYGMVGIGNFSSTPGPRVSDPLRRLEVLDKDSVQLRLTQKQDTNIVKGIHTDFLTNSNGNLFVQPDSNNTYKWTGLDFPIRGTVNTKLALDVNGQENLRTVLENDTIEYVLVWDSAANGNIKKRKLTLSGGLGNVSACDTVHPDHLDFVTKWTDTNPSNPKICRSQIYDNGTNVLINQGSTAITATTRLEADMNNASVQTIGIEGTSRNNAISGETWSYGIFGLCGASLSSGLSHNYGVYGQADKIGQTNYGLFGYSDSASSANYGVSGNAALGIKSYGGAFYSVNGSNDTYGIIADAYNSTVDTNFGVRGGSHGQGGINYGVYGTADGVSSGTTAGTNYGVYGFATNASNRNYGVYAYGLSSAATATYGIYTKAEANNSVCYGIYSQASTVSNNLNYGLYSTAGNGTKNYAGYFAGDIAYTGNLIPPSDSTLKTNINPLNNSLGIIEQLKPKTFYFDTAHYGFMNLPLAKQYGLISQNVRPIIPELVHPAIFPPQYDSLGTLIHDSVSYLGLDYMSLIPIIIGAVKQLDSLQKAQWSFIGNAGTNSATNYIGTSDSAALSIRTKGIQAIHIDSLQKVKLSSLTSSGDSMVVAHSDGTLGIKVLPALTEWNLTGNAGTNSATNFMGTTDNNGISIVTNNRDALHIDSLQKVKLSSLASSGDSMVIAHSDGTLGVRVIPSLLTNTEIAFGSSSNAMTSSSNLTWNGYSLGLFSGFAPSVTYNLFVNSGNDNISTHDNICLSTADGYAMSNISGGAYNTAVGGGSIAVALTDGSNNTFLGYNTNMTSGSINNSIALGANAAITKENQFVVGSVTMNDDFELVGSVTNWQIAGVDYTMPTHLGGAKYVWTDSSGNGDIRWEPIPSYDSVINAAHKLDSIQQVQIDTLQAQLTRMNTTLLTLLSCCQSSNLDTASHAGRTEDTIGVSLNNTEIILSQNDPNPFSEKTVINYLIPGNVQSAQIKFWDNTGVILNTITISSRGAGSIVVYASNLSSGIYTYALIADGKMIDSKKMVCQK